MPSPFPGMDPYLEGEVWSDVHQAVAGRVRDQLTPQVRPKYTARLIPRIVTEKNPGDEGDGAVVYPDTDIFLTAPAWTPGPSAATATLTPRTATVPMASALRWKLVTVEIWDRDPEELVTAVEVLSPVNKRGRGLLAYRRKRKRYWEQGANVVEIDLLRAGTRPFRGPGMPDSPYYVCLTPAGKTRGDVWAFGLRDALPTVPIPLRGDDGPAAVDLAAALTDSYDAAGYDLRVDYAADPPPPALSAEDAAFVAETLAPVRNASDRPADRDGE